jgi:tetratricopeptide (TPR) repeat protein
LAASLAIAASVTHGQEAAQPSGSSTAVARSGQLATTIGVVDAAEMKDGVLWFTLGGEERRFEVPLDDIKYPDTVMHALRASADSGNSVIVQYEADRGVVDRDSGQVVYAFRFVVYNHHPIAAAPAGSWPRSDAGESQAEKALALGMGLADADQRAEARQALGLALADDKLAPKLRVMALKARGELAWDEASENYRPGDPRRDPLLVEALADYRQAAATEPASDARSAYRVGQLLRDLGAYDEALTALRDVARRWPDERFWSTIRIAATYRILGDDRRALSTIDTLMENGKPPEGMPFHYHRGWTLTNLGRTREAVDEFTAGLRTQPDYEGAYSRRACALAREGRLSEALDDQQRFIAIVTEDVKDAEAPRSTPRHEFDARRAAEVVRELRAAIAERPDAKLDAPCKGYWETGDERRSRSALLPVAK